MGSNPKSAIFGDTVLDRLKKWRSRHVKAAPRFDREDSRDNALNVVKDQDDSVKCED